MIKSLDAKASGLFLYLIFACFKNSWLGEI